MQALYELSQAVGIRRGVAVIVCCTQDQGREYKRRFVDCLAQVNVHFHAILAKPIRSSNRLADNVGQHKFEEALRFCQQHHTVKLFTSTRANCQELEIIQRSTPRFFPALARLQARELWEQRSIIPPPCRINFPEAPWHQLEQRQGEEVL